MLFIITSLTLVFIYYNRKHVISSPDTRVTPTRDQSNKFSQLPRVIEQDPVDPKFGIDKEENNVAKEYKDDPEETNIEDDEDGGDSNHAQEEKNDDTAQIDLPLPPKDASIKFKGPQNERQRAVVSAFEHAWRGYRSYAWGMDHLKPISKVHQTWFGLGLTLIDSLDTMLVMNLREEFDEAQKWVEEELNFNINKDVNLFETTIRVLGGLLSTYHLSAEKIFLDKAIDLAGKMIVKTYSRRKINNRFRSPHCFFRYTLWNSVLRCQSKDEKRSCSQMESRQFNLGGHDHPAGVS